MRYSEYFNYARSLRESNPAKCIKIIHFTEEHASSAYDLKLAAQTWIDCFNDNDNAYRCMLLAECRWWNICRELIECAKFYLEIFNDKESASRCMHKASLIAGSDEDWERCEEFFRDIGYHDLADFCRT